jgi:hypothetical protein|tara:strand:+ start:1334 stop:1612 length:279 start_codon:yes stop_codon:yes gene_type:complete
MEKFLRIPVTNEQKQLVSCTDVKLVVQVNTTSASLAYGSGKVVTLTHAALAAGSEAMRDQIQDSMVEALATGWTASAFDMTPVEAVSGIAIA